jgi:two-component system sensor kinase FixL
LQQVVLNLVMNGIEAMADVPQSRRVLQVSTQLDGERNVRVAIEDSGLGLDPQTIDRIFEPFFTTKRDGIGMGLSICRTIVESHGGRVWASPRLRDGSIFCFNIPTVEKSHGSSL